MKLFIHQFFLLSLAIMASGVAACNRAGITAVNAATPVSLLALVTIVRLVVGKARGILSPSERRRVIGRNDMPLMSESGGAPGGSGFRDCPPSMHVKFTACDYSRPRCMCQDPACEVLDRLHAFLLPSRRTNLTNTTSTVSSRELAHDQKADSLLIQSMNTIYMEFDEAAYSYEIFGRVHGNPRQGLGADHDDF
ncbi:hypothetical protein AC579_4546 [Pseudocercospora musae]|uniref:Uncharacterized protein n=1 Tax=Pseudocercospora musae TaxID=113226 RepID=A0A139IUA4_9PEZI|nr:hypothetical protein AC579_4546 [Pseudocercospora musae]